MFDEKAVAEKLLNGKFIGNVTSSGNLNILGKYFKWQGMNDSDIQKNLIEYCQKFDPTFNDVMMADKLERAVKGTSYPIKLSHPVQISKGEMISIRTLEDVQLQKLLFTILAVAKYDHKLNTRSGFYYNDDNTVLFKMARLGNLRKQERVDAIHYLNMHKYIYADTHGAYEVVVAEGMDFPPADVQVIIENIEKVMDYFPWQCPKCGKDILGKPKRRKICDDCYVVQRRNDIRKNVQKTRENSEKDLV